MPDDSSKDPHGKEEPGEFTRIFQSLQPPRATAAPAPVAPETVVLPRSQSSAGPESFTQMFQALSPEPFVSPVTHPEEDAAGELSAQPPAQDAASFTQVLNSLLRPAVNSPPPLPHEEQSPGAILLQHSTSSAAKVDRDNEVTKIFAVSHLQPATLEPTKSALQRYLPLLLLLNGALLAILGVLVFLFLRHH